MRLSVEQSLPVRPDELMTLMSDEKFVVFRASVESTTVEGSVVDPAADGSLRITLRRTMPSSQIAVQVRAFVGSRLEVRHVEVWEPPKPGRWFGTVAVEITGTPVRMSGTVSLAETPEGCTVTYEGTVTASLPVFGAAVEEAAAATLRSVLDAEEERVRAWLRGARQGA